MHKSHIYFFFTVDISNETFKKVKTQLCKFVDNFGFPLLAMDIMSCKCMRPGFSLLQLLGPAVEFIGFELEQEKMAEILVVSHSMTAGSAITCGQQKPEYWASVLFPWVFIFDILTTKVLEIKEYHEGFLALGCFVAASIMGGYLP